jgi:hypothetical protein
MHPAMPATTNEVTEVRAEIVVAEVVPDDADHSDGENVCCLVGFDMDSIEGAVYEGISAQWALMQCIADAT